MPADVRFKFPMVIVMEAKTAGVYPIVLNRDITVFDVVTNMTPTPGAPVRIDKGVVTLRCGATVLGRVNVRPNTATRIQTLYRDQCLLRSGCTLTVEITDAENVYLDIWAIPLPRQGIHS
jgi:hypothetical protein